MVKVKISYEREEELFRVLRLLEPVIVKWKRSKNQDGRFKKAYAELCGPWKLHANPNEVRGNYGKNSERSRGEAKGEARERTPDEPREVRAK